MLALSTKTALQTVQLQRRKQLTKSQNILATPQYALNVECICPSKYELNAVVS